MSIYQYKGGLQNAASYQSSGTPFVTGSAALAGVMKVEFPTVTKEIQIVIEGAGDGLVYFHPDAPILNKMHFSSVPFRMNVKCKELYVENVGGAIDFRVYASLTGIRTSEMFALTGSGITK